MKRITLCYLCQNQEVRKSTIAVLGIASGVLAGSGLKRQGYQNDSSHRAM